MKFKRWKLLTYGLRARFARSLLISGIFCCLVFAILYAGTDFLISEYFVKTDYESRRVERQGENLQEYIDRNEIASNDLVRLKKWERRQPIILLEIYSEGQCIYSAFNHTAIGRQGVYYDEQRIQSLGNAVTLELLDKEVTAVLYSDFTYQFYLFGTFVSFLISLLLFVLWFIRDNSKLIYYICKLNTEVQILEGGNLDHEVTVRGNDELTDLAKSMNRMRESFQDQLNREHEIYEANRRLVTEMSHDLRTPLTGILLYTEILRSHKYEDEKELDSYLEKIESKAEHMKILSDHLFEYALDETAEKMSEPVLMKEALADETANLLEELQARGFTVSSELMWESCYIATHPESLRRIFGNILSNIEKYAESSLDIRIETVTGAHYCGLTVLNNRSRTDEEIASSGIGLESIRRMMEQMGGRCIVEETEEMFEVVILFPKRLT